MKSTLFNSSIKKIGGTAFVLFTSISVMAQSNVYDDIISVSPDHTSLTAAISAAGLESALQNPAATLTVFAPDNDAFNDLASDLGTDIPGLLALPNLSDILLYHVLGVNAQSSGIMNGDIVTPLNTANTIKLTKTATGSVYANHAMVEAADLNADNGVVHSIDAVILSNETVVDVAIDNSFTSLTTAVITAELLPALQDPFATYTVFAPSNLAFDNLAAALGTDISGLLALQNLSDILLYHVLGSEAAANDINNGDIVNALNTDNTIKLTKTSMGEVYANQAQVTLADVNAENGVVHAIDAVILPYETVVDVAIDNGFTTLTAAIVKAELLPALSNPLGTFTVFAPTNAAFDNLASSLGTDLNGVLALPNLADVLLYHVVGSVALSTDLSNGNITTLESSDVIIDLTSGVMVNDASVDMADVTADNGVVHVIDKVLIPGTASINEDEFVDVKVYPNPTSNFVRIDFESSVATDFKVVNDKGQVVLNASQINSGEYIDLSALATGNYTISFEVNSNSIARRLVITSDK